MYWNTLPVRNEESYVALELRARRAGLKGSWRLPVWPTEGRSKPTKWPDSVPKISTFSRAVTEHSGDAGVR